MHISWGVYPLHSGSYPQSVRTNPSLRLHGMCPSVYWKIFDTVGYVCLQIEIVAVLMSRKLRAKCKLDHFSSVW